MSEFFTELGAEILDFYSDLWNDSPFYFVLALLTTWCCLAHCVFQPLCICRKRENKIDKSLYYTGKDDPFRIVAAHRGGSHERAE